jgi:cytidine deaminase
MTAALTVDKRLLWPQLSVAAWAARENAKLYGKTKVGCAVLSQQENVYAGCNIEHRFRAHDVHAEVNALSSMQAAGDGHAVAVLIAARRDKFTPCGGCMDWIFELGGPATLVAFQSDPDAKVQILSAQDLMPHYPY